LRTSSASARTVIPAAVKLLDHPEEPRRRSPPRSDGCRRWRPSRGGFTAPLAGGGAEILARAQACRPRRSTTKLSWLPAGPWQAGRREAEHRATRAPSSALAHRSRGRRAGPRPSAPRRPCPRARGRTSNCGLTRAQGSRSGSAAQASTAGSTFAREMNENVHRDQVWPVRQQRQVERARVCRSTTFTRGRCGSSICSSPLGHVESKPLCSRAALEQAVREAARWRPPTSQAGSARADRARKRSSALATLHAAARHVAGRSSTATGASGATSCPAFCARAPSLPNLTLARHYRRGGSAERDRTARVPPAACSRRVFAIAAASIVKRPHTRTRPGDVVVGAVMGTEHFESRCTRPSSWRSPPLSNHPSIPPLGLAPRPVIAGIAIGDVLAGIADLGLRAERPGRTSAGRPRGL